MGEMLGRWHVDGQTLVRERGQDVTPILEHNAELRGQEQCGEWRHTSTIPLVIIERWFNEEYARGNIGLRIFSAEFNALIARKLEDPDWAFLRTDNKSNPFHVGWRNGNHE